MKQFKGMALSDLTDVEIITTEKCVSILLSADNTELLEGKIYNSVGGLNTAAPTYDTLYFPIGNYKSFLLSNYPTGSNGGAFVKQDKTWISSFQTDGTNAEIKKVVPVGAYYIAISVPTSHRYKSISAYYDDNKYRFNSLVQNNQWSGKKVVWIGTSISFGANATKSYAVEASNKLGFTLINASVPGQAIHTYSNGIFIGSGSTALSIAEYAAQNLTIPTLPLDYAPGGSYNDYYRTWENIFTEDNADADLWVFDVAPNNTNFATTDWDEFDKVNWRYADNSEMSAHRTTFLGALLFLMDKMYALNPQARMVFILGSGYNYANGTTAFGKLKTLWNIPIIDIWGKINTSPKSLLQINSLDGINDHPSTFAHEILGQILSNELLLIA